MDIGIIGYGRFGVLLHEMISRFTPKAQVRVFSRGAVPDSKVFFTLAEVAQCDAVVLAVPIHVFEDRIKEILPLLGKGSIVVDVATVKTHTVEILKRHLGTRPFVATHPMFGPESYEKKDKDVNGFRIVITEHTLMPEQHDSFVAFLTQCGFDVVEMSAESHDKHLAETLFLTHFIGQVVSRGGFNRTQIDTVSFGYLMDAVESVRHDIGLFQDVYRFNPYCEEMLKKFEIAEAEVHELLQRKK
ncbi:prephenate dehydrogenase [Acetobacteraceae bacterium]|nr:prephenate dehydrogenase [Candidatus Parcubacteria bacterium]